MAGNDLSNQLGLLNPSQLATIAYESGVDANGQVIPAAQMFWSNLGQTAHTWQSALGTGSSVTYTFATASDGSTFSQMDRSAALQAFALWSDLANITFTPFAGVGTVDVSLELARETYGAGASATTLGKGTSFSLPVADQTPTATSGLMRDTNGGVLQFDQSGGFGIPGIYNDPLDGYGISTLVHETGHLLGLGHTGPYNAVPGAASADYGSQGYNATDVLLWSIMSYIDPRDQTDTKYYPFSPLGTSWLTPGETPQPGNQDTRAPFTPMGLDIFAAQRLYGAPTNGVLSGGQTFGFNSNVMFTDTDGSAKRLSMYDFSNTPTTDAAPVVTLYDTGTDNTLDLSGFGTSSTIDLNPGGWSSVDGMTNNIFIEYGTVIDHAVGSMGGNSFILNGFGDTIDGGSGGAINTVTLSKPRSAYAVGHAGGAITLTDMATAAVNKLTNIQSVSFSDVTVASANLATVTWTGAVDDQFTTSGNWDVNNTPSSVSDVVIAIAAPARVDKVTPITVDSVQIGPIGTLQIDTGQFAITDGTESSVNLGEFDVNAVGTEVDLRLSGTFENDGRLSLVGPGAELLTNDSTVTVTGNGAIVMTRGNIGGRIFADATPFDTLVSSNVIRGSGTIGLDGFVNTITFVNKGTVKADDVESLAIVGSVVNQGLLSGASSSSDLFLHGAFDNSLGHIDAQNGGAVQFDTITVSGGTIDALGTGKLDVIGIATFDGTNGGMTLNGNLTIDAGALLTLTNITLNGDVTVAAGGSLRLAGGVTGGTIDASAGTIYLNSLIPPAGVTLIGGAGHIRLNSVSGQTFAANVTLSDGVTVGGGNSATFFGNIAAGANDFTNPTIIALNGGAAGGALLFVNGLANLKGGGTVTLTGTGDAITGLGTSAAVADALSNVDNKIFGAGLIGGANFAITNGASGTIMANGGTLVLDPGSASLNSFGGLVGAAAGSSLELVGTLNLSGAAALANTGTLVLGGTDFFRSAAGAITGGTIPAGLIVSVTQTGTAAYSNSANAGTFVVGAGATLNMSSDINNGLIILRGDSVTNLSLTHNAGTVALNGSIIGVTHHGATLNVKGGANLSGGGLVTLQDAADTIVGVSNSSTLQNFDNTIAGTGQLGGGLLNFINRATVNANVPGSALVMNTGTGKVYDFGVMEATGGGTLSLSGTMTGDPLALNSIDNAGTLLASGLGSLIWLNAGTFTDFAIQGLSGGAVDVTGNVTLIGDTNSTDLFNNALDNNARMQIQAGDTLTLVGGVSVGWFTNQATVSLNGTFASGSAHNVGAVLRASGTMELDGGGTITLGNAADTITGASTTDLLKNHDNTIQGTGRLGGGNLGFQNSGTVNANAGALIVDGGTRIVSNTNRMEATPGGTLIVNSALSTGGTLLAQGGTVDVEGPLSGSGLYISGGEMILAGSVSSGANIRFDSAAAGASLLKIGNLAHMAGTVIGFFAGDTIDFAGIQADGYSFGDSFTGLTLTSGGVTVGMLPMPLSVSGIVTLSPDKSGGTDVVVTDITTQGTTVTVSPRSGQTISLDDIVNQTNFAPAGTFQSLVLNGAGTDTVAGSVTITNLEVGGGQLLLSGATVKTDPVTVDAQGNISGFGTVTGAVTNLGTITASGGTLELTASVTGIGTLAVTPGAAMLLDLGASSGAVTVNGGALSAAGELDAGQAGLGGLLVENQATATTGTGAVSGAQGLEIAQAAGSGDAIVTGAKSLLANTGSFVVGDAGLGALGIQSAGVVTTTPVSGGLGMVIANTSSASGSSVNVSGAGSSLAISGTLVVGNAGQGLLNIAQGGVVTAASIDEAAAVGGDGVISIAGTGSALTLTGSLTVGDNAAGEFSILGGATVSALDVTIGNASAASSGNVDVEGAGSSLLIGTGGVLNVGVAGGGSGVLTIGAGTTLHSAAGIVEAGHASFNNNGGVVDPPFVDFTGPSNAGLGSNSYDLYVENIGAVQLIGGTGVWTTPMMLTGTSVADASNNINVNGDTGAWQLSSGGTLIVNANTVDAGQAVVFEDATDTLVIGQIVNNGSAGVSGTAPVVAPGAENLMQASGWAAAIWGYVAGDKIQFANMAVSSASVVNGNTVDLFGPGNVSLGSLAFFNKAGSKASPAGAAAAAAQIPCFAAGTRIGTPEGWVTVEDLTVGDRVLTHHGEARDIVWIGRRTVNCALHPKPKTVWPVRVATGAFGENVPARDLYLSPDHAVFVNDVLVPVKLLIDGTDITQIPRDMVSYFHVELEEHSVILAEGLTVESYLDIGDRLDFDRDGGAMRLFPRDGTRLRPDAASIWETMAAARLIVRGFSGGGKATGIQRSLGGGIG